MRCDGAHQDIGRAASTEWDHDPHGFGRELRRMAVVRA
jgi:hypothetical protein